MMKITGLSHLFKWENLHNWWLTKYFFAPLYKERTQNRALRNTLGDLSPRRETIPQIHGAISVLNVGGKPVQHRSLKTGYLLKSLKKDVMIYCIK